MLSSVVANRNNNIDFFKPSQKNKFTNSIKIGEPIENSRENSINTIKSSNDIQLQIVLDKIINIEKTQNKILDKISNLQFSNKKPGFSDSRFRIFNHFGFPDCRIFTE